MKFLDKTIILIACLVIGINISGQTVASPFEVGTWQEFKSAAVSYTFDDNCPNQLATVVPMFNNLGFKLTLFTVINWGPNWTGLQNAANNGHEIASHTLSHNSLNTLSDANQTTEYLNSKNSINDHIKGQTCLTIAYPNCVVGNSALCSQYYMAARGCQGYVESTTPTNFMNISSIICGSQGSVKTASDFNAKVDNAASSKGWCVFLMHAIDGDSGYSPTQSSELSAHLNYINSNINKFWVNTFGNVARYIKERNNVSLTVISNQSNNITIQLTDNLDNTLYNYPVSIRRPLPQGWTGASVTQGTTVLSSKILDVNSMSYIMFDAVPDAGNIVIAQRNTTDIGSVEQSVSSDNIKLWKDKEKLLIDVPSSAGTNLHITFYDLKGAVLASLEKNRVADKIVGIDLVKIPAISGIKIVRVSDGQNSWSKQMPVF